MDHAGSLITISHPGRNIMPNSIQHLWQIYTFLGKKHNSRHTRCDKVSYVNSILVNPKDELYLCTNFTFRILSPQVTSSLCWLAALFLDRGNEVRHFKHLDFPLKKCWLVDHIYAKLNTNPWSRHNSTSFSSFSTVQEIRDF